MNTQADTWQYQWIEDPSEFEALSEAWDAALRRAGDDNPFLLSAFVLTWWKYYGRNGTRLRILVVRSGDTLVGGLPLYDQGGGLLTFPGGIAANYTEWLAVQDQHRLWQMLLEALAQRTDWRRLRLPRYRASRLATDWEVLRVAARERGVLCDVLEKEQTYLILLSEGSRGCFQRLPSRLRSYLRRSERELSRRGPIVLRSSDQWDTVRDWFNLYCQFSVRAFQQRKQDSAFSDDRYRMFVRDVLEQACQNHTIDANVLTVGERIIAIHFGYSLRDHLNYIFTTFDSDFADWRPGHLLIHRLVQLAEERRNSLIDLFSGGKLYKRQWSNRQEAVLCVELWRDTLSGRVARRCVQRLRTSRVLRAVERAVRRSPSLLQWARRSQRGVRYIAQSKRAGQR